MCGAACECCVDRCLSVKGNDFGNAENEGRIEPNSSIRSVRLADAVGFHPFNDS